MKHTTTILLVVSTFALTCIGPAIAQQPAAAQKAPAAPAASTTTPADAAATARATPPGMDRDAEEAAIRANAEKYVEAYNRRDSATMAKMWSPEAVYLDPRTGEGIVGRDAIRKASTSSWPAPKTPSWP